jgi:acyl-CoA dehydrogenase
MSLVEASIILEEINRSGGNAGPCHAQMYTMGTLLRHGWVPDAEAGLPTQNCQWRTAPTGVWSDRTGSRHGYHEYYNDGGTSG